MPCLTIAVALSSRLCTSLVFTFDFKDLFERGRWFHQPLVRLVLRLLPFLQRMQADVAHALLQSGWVGFRLRLFHVESGLPLGSGR